VVNQEIEMKTPLKAVVVGCRMGAGHASCFAKIKEYKLVGVCDLREDVAKAAAEKSGNPTVYSDFGKMLAETKPDVVAIATPNASHAALTQQSLEAGVKAICAEKPMAVHLADGRRMVEACRAKGVPLIVNHQRRVGPDLTLMRSMIDQGVLGEVCVVRGNCAGDILSDGTHLVDSIMWLAGDREVEWVLGQVHRVAPKKSEGGGAGFDVKNGFRFGHPIETGGFAVAKLKDGPRVEIACGDLRVDYRAYQDYEVVGAKGTLWRTGDETGSNLFVCDGKPGNLVAGIDEKWRYKPVAPKSGNEGPWRSVSLSVEAIAGLKDGENAMMRSYRLFVDTILNGASHPMSGENALRGFEVIAAIYESARLRAKVALPLGQDRFALEMMVKEGLL
jgi:UDP-N-acetyl-2-amino-2-deoxyglucuronate dehydrogenase